MPEVATPFSQSRFDGIMADEGDGQTNISVINAKKEKIRNQIPQSQNIYGNPLKDSVLNNLIHELIELQYPGHSDPLPHLYGGSSRRKTRRRKSTRRKTSKRMKRR
jgi:hypothetical protein